MGYKEIGQKIREQINLAHVEYLVKIEIEIFNALQVIGIDLNDIDIKDLRLEKYGNIEKYFYKDKLLAQGEFTIDEKKN